jgi:Outer membrane protein beta-barrel domain
MKNFLIIAALALAPAFSFAQFQIGIKGGVNLSKFSLGSDIVTTRLNANGSPAVSTNGQTLRDNLQNSLNSKTGTSFGIYTRFGKNFFIQPELLYSTKGGSFDIIRTGANGQPETVTQNTTVTSFDVPVLIGIKGGPIRIMAGPMASFRLSDNQNLRDALKTYTAGTLNDAWAKAYYGYQVGGGLDLGRLGIDVRYEGSLTDVVSVGLGANGTTPAQFSQKLKSWQVTLAYKIL